MSTLLAAAAMSTRRCNCVEPEPGPRPPSSSGFDQSKMISEGSKSYLLPRPLHSGHAPYTLLKENERGSSAGTLMPQFGQAIFAEYNCSSPPTMEISTSP